MPSPTPLGEFPSRLRYAPAVRHRAQRCVYKGEYTADGHRRQPHIVGQRRGYHLPRAGLTLPSIGRTLRGMSAGRIVNPNVNIPFYSDFTTRWNPSLGCGSLRSITWNLSCVPLWKIQAELSAQTPLSLVKVHMAGILAARLPIFMHPREWSSWGVRSLVLRTEGQIRTLAYV